MKKKFKILPLINSSARCFVDVEDFEWLMEREWRLDNNYVSAVGRKGVRLHKYITGILGLKKVDHKDHNTLNNRRHNLRPCTSAQNTMNSRKGTRRVHSRYKGVHHEENPERFDKVWRARIRINGRLFCLGYYKTEALAARAYDAAALYLFKEFSCLNFESSKIPISPHKLRSDAIKINRSKYRSAYDGVNLLKRKHKLKNPWRAFIAVRLQQYHLGTFKTRAQAIKARRNAEDLFSKNGVDNTWSMNEIKNLLGHSSSKTTEGYVH